MINPCFLKQTKDRYFVYSTTNDRMFSNICRFPRYSESKCLQLNYISDYESYLITATKFVIIQSLSYFSKSGYSRIRYEAYVD